MQIDLEEAIRLRNECRENKAKYSISKVETTLTPLINTSRLVHYCTLKGMYCEYQVKENLKCEWPERQDEK